MATPKALHTFDSGTNKIAIFLPDEYSAIEDITGFTKSTDGLTNGAVPVPVDALVKRGLILKVSIGVLIGTIKKRKSLYTTATNVSNIEGLVGKAIGTGTIKSASPRTYRKLR
jgi:hypothetical protein